MKRNLFYLFILLGLSELAWAASATEPTIDFGTIYFCPDGSGFSTVAVSDASSVTHTGSGNITNQTGGAAGTVEIEKNILELASEATVTTKKTSKTVSGCGGTVTIKNTTTTGGATSASGGRWSLSASFNIGADLVVSSFSQITGTDAPCTLSGTISDLLTYKVGTFGRDTALNVNITAQIVPVAKLSHADGQALDFGQICLSNQQQTVTISPAGTVTYTNLRCLDLGHTSADQFNIVAPTGLVYNVSVPNSADISNGIDTLTVSAFTPSCTSCTMAGTSATLTVGGTLTIPPNISIGDYTGSYQVTVTY